MEENSGLAMYDLLLLPLSQKQEGMESDHIFLYNGLGDINGAGSYDVFTRAQLLQMHQCLQSMNDELLRAAEPGYAFEQAPEMLFEEGDEAGHDEEAGAAGSGTESGEEERSSSRADSQAEPEQEETSSDPSEADSSKRSNRVVEFNEDD